MLWWYWRKHCQYQAQFNSTLAEMVEETIPNSWLIVAISVKERKLIAINASFTIKSVDDHDLTLVLQGLDSVIGNLSIGQFLGTETPATASQLLVLILAPVPHVLLHDAHVLQPPHWQLNPLKSGQAPYTDCQVDRTSTSHQLFTTAELPAVTGLLSSVKSGWLKTVDIITYS